MVWTLSRSTYWGIGAVTAVLQVIGLLLTVFRLWFRFNARRLWWEDFWAALALVCGIMSLVSEWTWLVVGDGKPAVVAIWIYSFAFTNVVWIVRISIALSITRIIYPTRRLRFAMHFFTALLGVMWAGLVTQKAFKCASNLDWYKLKYPHCTVTRAISIYEVTADFVADTILVAFPLRLLWKVRLPKNQRRMILSIFSSSIIVSIVSIFHAVCQTMYITALISVALDVEIAASLAVCNLLVVTTFIYRYLQRKQHVETIVTETDDDYTSQSPSSGAAQFLTIVDLNALSGDSDESQQSWNSQAVVSGHPTLPTST
ncbi:hypothetical protein HYDPIDRAFT_116844 [Hydnomerulius pinastri MD-312]|uniref:Rhodopsin domain-containing protein n=1 Tax=Hydnomerulius pinastri MD-312 TaxID=994086 RepID=A0A0C9W3J9_9AGAM|nr:hypothetical protein HYDPIDRAFT_116844 [Hydnomerulius pinastri MD-312]